MLSIVVCSINANHFEQFCASVEKTVGVEYEIVKIDNNREKLSLCRAYNKGAAASKFDYLCFVHEDTVFHSSNWGRKVIEHLNDKETGLIGIAGSSYVPFVPSGWLLTGSPEKNRMNWIQSYKYSAQPTTRFLENDNADNRVFALDGVFLGMRREVFDEFKFNENVPGFHAYDLDLSLRVARKYRNKVVFDILLEHLSEGSFDREWFKNTLLVRENINGDFGQTLDKNAEHRAFIQFVLAISEFEPNALTRWRTAVKYFSPRRIGYKRAWLTFLKMHYHVFKLRNTIDLRRLFGNFATRSSSIER